MDKYFDELVLQAESINAEGDLRLHLIASVRLLLQQAVFGLLEWASKQPAVDNAIFPSDLLSSQNVPSDGALIDSLESLVIYCEQAGWSGISRTLFSPVADEAACRALCLGEDGSISSLLRGLVRLRNDGAEGHGLSGGYQKEAELDCLRNIVKHLGPLLPRIAGNDAITLGPEGRVVELRFLRLFEGRPALIRKIRSNGSARLRVEAQYYGKSKSRKTVTYESANVFTGLSATTPPTLVQWNNSWSPLCYLPDRTTESFQGRSDEQHALTEWMNDEESRTCLVFGDGGVGKTTLVLEFLHRYLEDDPDIEIGWKPKIISFYTAKKWRWGLEGIELITSGQPHLLGLITHLHLLLFSALPSQDFYRLDVKQAAIRLQQKMTDELKINRREHLIVIDNSETLITSACDVEILGQELREIGRRVGRVLITSRRRELIEAAPVPVAALKPVEAVSLLKDRGKALRLRSIIRAQDGVLLSLVNDLECRPLVLEAFLHALTDPATVSLKAAKDRVAGMLRRDLGEFLFADAWARFTPKMKHLLLLLTRVGDVHDARQLNICCEIAGVSMQAAEEALEESSGIASVVVVNGGIEVSLSANFLEFAREKFIHLNEKRRPTEEEVSGARRQYARFVQAVNAFAGDRICNAFRTPLAKAAHKARKDGQLDEALRLFQQAVLGDAGNGWLFDRFAYFLFHDMRDNASALVQAKRATELLPSEGEAWFTRGIVEARLGDFRQCELSLQKAESLGIDRVRCGIQLGWAYLKSSPVMLNLARKQIDSLRQALATRPRTDRNVIEMEVLTSRLAYLESKGRNVRGRYRT